MDERIMAKIFYELIKDLIDLREKTTYYHYACFRYIIDIMILF